MYYTNVTAAFMRLCKFSDILFLDLNIYGIYNIMLLFHSVITALLQKLHCSMVHPFHSVLEQNIYGTYNLRYNTE